MIHISDIEGLFRIEAKEPIGVDTRAGKDSFMATKCTKSTCTSITGTTMARTKIITTTAMITGTTMTMEMITEKTRTTETIMAMIMTMITNEF